MPQRARHERGTQITGLRSESWGTRDGVEGGEDSCWLLVAGCRLGDGRRVGIGLGVQEVVEHLSEVVVACFFRVFGGGEFGDGGDGTEVGVEDDVFDRGVCVHRVRGAIGAGLAAAGLTGGAAGGCRAGLAGEIGADDLQAVEKASGALGVDLIGCDEGEDLGEGELDSVAVV